MLEEMDTIHLGASSVLVSVMFQAFVVRKGDSIVLAGNTLSHGFLQRFHGFYQCITSFISIIVSDTKH
jgi:hypothetical protein